MNDTTCPTSTLDYVVGAPGKTVILCPTCGKVINTDRPAGSMTEVPTHDLRVA